jgi:hypothetical protein
MTYPTAIATFLRDGLLSMPAIISVVAWRREGGFEPPDREVATDARCFLNTLLSPALLR